MDYQAIQIVEERLQIHKAKQKGLVVRPDSNMPPMAADAIRNERKIEDAIVEELEELRREMMQN